jgi:serine/threonine protein kinase
MYGRTNLEAFFDEEGSISREYREERKERQRLEKEMAAQIARDVKARRDEERKARLALQREEHQRGTVFKTLPIIPESDMKDVKYISKGGFGEVIRGAFPDSAIDDLENVEKDVQYAHKIGHNSCVANMKRSVSMQDIAPDIREMAILFDSNHENVMRGVCTYYIQAENGNVCQSLVMDLAEGILDLDNQEYQTWDVCAQMLLGLNHLHINGVAHHDLKPQNVLMYRNSENNRIIPKISDFGLMRIYENVNTTARSSGVGTVDWFTPEMLDSYQRRLFLQINRKDDLYTMGLIIIKLLGRTNSFELETRRSPINYGTILNSLKENTYIRPEHRGRKPVRYESKMTYSVKILTKIAIFLNANFMNRVPNGRTDLNILLGFEEFKEICELTDSRVTFPVKERSFTCLVPKNTPTLESRNEIIKKSLKIIEKVFDYLEKTIEEIEEIEKVRNILRLVTIYGVDLFDRVIASDEKYVLEKYASRAKLLKIADGCIKISMGMFNLMYPEDKISSLEVYSEIIAAVNGTLYRSLVTYLESEYDVEDFEKMILLKPINHIINQGCEYGVVTTDLGVVSRSSGSSGGKEEEDDEESSDEFLSALSHSQPSL